MKLSVRTLSFLLLSLCSTALPAATIVECEDAAGERTFLAVCPPGTTLVERKEYQTEIPDTATPASELVALIYIAPNCPACDAFQNFFTQYGIVPTVKNIEGDPELQMELMKLAGALKIPTVIIGETVLSAYREQELIELIEGMGYRLAKKATP